MKYIMGLDIGISSVGWAVINDEKHRIEDLGVRLFSAAEKPKDGGPINAERREARGLRRRLKRRKVRMDKIKELFVKYGLISREDKDKLYILNAEDMDTWQLRNEGLDRKLNQREWARVLTAIAKRRGYQSNRKNEADLDKTGESKKILNAIKLNKVYMMEKGYRTVGEMLAKDERYQGHKRNKHGDYSNCIDRSELEEEVITLFDCQRKFGNEYTSKNFEKEYLEVFRYQKGFMSAELMEKMIGKCTLEKEEPRISKNTWTFERFMLLQKINNLSYESPNGKVYLSPQERERIIQLAYDIKSGVKYTRIKKELNLPADTKFVGLNYFIKGKKNKDGTYERPSDEEIIKKTEDSVFVKLSGYHEIKDALLSNGLEDCFNKIIQNHDLMDDIAKELTLNKTSVTIEEGLRKLGLENQEITALENINFTKFGHLSKKAISNILPYLEKGLQYDAACREAGYNYKDDDASPKYKLPVIPKEDIRNPVVYRAVTQTRKVINAIINKYGSPFEVHVEVGSELTKSFRERKEIENKQKENRVLNEKLKTEIEEGFGIKAKPVDMLKVKLYREQQGKSAYSLLPIDYSRLFEDGYVQIDHAVPFSRSFDDSYNNKVLVLSKENQDKRNMTPYEFLGGTAQWEVFEAFVKEIYKFRDQKREKIFW